MLYQTKHWLALALVCGLIVVRSSQAGAEQPLEPNIVDDAVEVIEENLLEPNWIDSSYGYASHSTDVLAIWLDQFFGVPRTDLESAYSSIRLGYEVEKIESEGINSSYKIRGKVHLPKLNKRLSVIFSDEEGDAEEAEDGEVLIGLRACL